jgi:hypothetical protein
VSDSPTLRELQTNLSWLGRYSRDFRANPQSHKDFGHALLHVLKAAGKLSVLVDEIDHDHEVAHDPSLREKHGRFVADLVYCALRLANTFPGGVLDLEAEVLRRISEKNACPKPQAPPAFVPRESPPWVPPPAGPVGVPMLGTPVPKHVPDYGSVFPADALPPDQIGPLVGPGRRAP